MSDQSEPVTRQRSYCLTRKINIGLNYINRKYLPRWLFSSPRNATIELSTVCNLRCPVCPAGQRQLAHPNEFMDPEVFKACIDRLNPRFVTRIIPGMWGEGLLHPEFVTMMEYVQATGKGYSIWMSTNGQIDPDKVDLERLMRVGILEVMVAVDGHDQETYTQYRQGGSFDRLQTFVKRLHEARQKTGSPTRLGGLVVVSRHNEDHLSDIRRLFQPYLDSVQTKPMRFFMDFKRKPEFQETYMALRPKSPEFQYLPPSERRRPICEGLFTDIYINVKGELTACCGDPSNYFVFGSVLKDEVYDLRRTERFRQFRRRVIDDPASLPQCRTCLFEY